MLTEDQNIIDVDFIVQWRIKNAADYLFNIRDPEGTMKLVAESAIREIMGQTLLEDALTIKRQEVDERTKELLQQILDNYGAGVFIAEVRQLKVDPPAEVIDAFNDVQRARQDQDRSVNEATAYRNDIVPRAKGEAERIIQEANAYKERLTAEAEGEANRFVSVSSLSVGPRHHHPTPVSGADARRLAQHAERDHRSGDGKARAWFPTCRCRSAARDRRARNEQAHARRYRHPRRHRSVLLFNSAFTVRQTEQALILQFGNPVRVERKPGLKFKVPFIQNVEFFDKRILDLDPPPQEVLLADQKRINVDSFARYRIVDPLRFRQRAQPMRTSGRFSAPHQLGRAHRGGAHRPGRGAVDPADRGHGPYRRPLKAQAPEFGVEVVDVRIGRTDLPEATSQAVYNRMRSARVAQAAQLRAEGEQQKARIQAEADRERTVILAEATRQSQILRGQGDGERTITLNQAYSKDPAFFDFYRSLEAYGALAGPGTTMVLKPDTDFFRFFLDEGARRRPSRR